MTLGNALAPYFFIKDDIKVSIKDDIRVDGRRIPPPPPPPLFPFFKAALLHF